MDLLREEKAGAVGGWVFSCLILFPLKKKSPPFSGIIKIDIKQCLFFVCYDGKKSPFGTTIWGE